MTYSLEEVRSAVKILNTHMQLRKCSMKDYRLGYEAVFELLDQDWADIEIDPSYQEGYEQCMADIADAISDEWGVTVWFEEPGCCVDPEEE